MNPDWIDEIVDWQLNRRRDPPARTCTVCRTMWTGWATTCPDCGKEGP